VKANAILVCYGKQQTRGGEVETKQTSKLQTKPDEDATGD